MKGILGSGKNFYKCINCGKDIPAHQTQNRKKDILKDESSRIYGLDNKCLSCSRVVSVRERLREKLLKRQLNSMGFNKVTIE
jgi:DNA-directed RNA polymerase subunit RPC12/RpoP